jgi:hypothetical protein
MPDVGFWVNLATTASHSWYPPSARRTKAGDRIRPEKASLARQTPAHARRSGHLDYIRRARQSGSIRTLLWNCGRNSNDLGANQERSAA